MFLSCNTSSGGAAVMLHLAARLSSLLTSVLSPSLCQNRPNGSSSGRSFISDWTPETPPSDDESQPNGRVASAARSSGVRGSEQVKM